ncbi:HK97 gp10 family phage protein [Pseudohoeflea suaedae]|uniref:HK97 gp10 family phage protein n=1 Tax=Pseudohoeflea suaedae TaxID=877384 RepID=A0A4V3A707_9HYPH|nr:HK97-gp10 family putative phage morphogenesis protein [Pseudohoeflea suaedae]TDH35722.1 HK97 gp10 family phage protein [Pseudohoeflea suaedae]
MAIQGLDRLKRKLTVTIPDAVRKAARASLEKGANEIVTMMRALVPRDTGALAASIGWTWGDAPKGALTLGTVKNPREGDEYITIFAGTRDKSLGAADAYYVGFVEFGTKHAKPYPFFYPSYRALKKRVKSRNTREINKALKSAGIKK